MMKSNFIRRRLSSLLIVVMLLSVLSPAVAYAESESQQELGDETVLTAVDPEVSPEVNSDDTVEITPVTSYEEFLTCLKVLETYADSYAASSGENAVGLVINYIRTGIEKYNTESWAILAGAENTAFTAYVAEQDTVNGTTAQALRGIGSFTLPNGQGAEFAHMFGAINIAYYNNYAQTN
ncbi:hypothetical protein, partial [Porcincola intestinalis]|uniref:hypothetical protein n=1 Tax=Porcincola intestinalis TaxID=2606632 RepID=UPI002A82074C